MLNTINKLIAFILVMAVIIPSMAFTVSAAQSSQQLMRLENSKPITLHSLETLGNSLVSVAIIIDKTASYTDVQEFYTSLREVKFVYFGHEFSVVASRLVRDRDGNYVVKLFGPANKLHSIVKTLKLPIKRLVVKPLVNAMNMYLPSKLEIVEDFGKPSRNVEPVNIFARKIVGADIVNEVYNITGRGVAIAIVDTGVDYGHPDLQTKLMYWVGEYYDVDGYPVTIREPLVLDADETHVMILESFEPNASGYIVVEDEYFIVLEPFPWYVYAPCDAYYVGNITSASGEYRFGVTDLLLPTASGWAWINLGVLLADPETPGNYTDLYIDVNNNCRFTDPEDIHVTYDGDRILVSPNKASPLISLGVAGGFFYDWWWWFSYPGRILPGWDLKGRYLSIFYDFHGHGTACASAAAGSGSVFQGIAPDAKIIGVKALWIGNVELGMLWAAGFDVSLDGFIYYTGEKRADIISNSWGISWFIYDISGFGYDFESMFVNALTVPHYLDPRFPGIVIVQAAGNGGNGFGTMTSPGAAAGAITVGASTSMWIFWYLYGFGGFTYDQVVYWSARGPVPAGYLKPDVVNIGAWGITARPIGWGRGVGYTIFGGTSYATPLTAGAVALIYEALYRVMGERAKDIAPSIIKHLLMSTAKNLGYTPLDEGAGRVDVLRAVEAILKAPNELVITSRSYYQNTYKKLNYLWYWYMADYIPLYFIWWVGTYFIPPVIPPDPSIPKVWSEQPYYGVYIPDIPQDRRGEFDLEIYNPFNSNVKVSLKAIKFTKLYSLERVYRLSLDREQIYVDKWLIIPKSRIPSRAKIMQIEVSIPFSVFDGDGDYSSDYEVWLFTYIWIADWDRDGYPDVSERAVIDLAWASSNYNIVKIANPRKLLDEFGPNAKLAIRIILIRGMDYIPAKESVRNVRTLLAITYFTTSTDRSIKLYPSKAIVKAGKSLQVKGYIFTRKTTMPTVYQNYIEVEAQLPNGKIKTYYVPLTYTVTIELRGERVRYLNPLTDVYRPYTSSHLRGCNDWFWRYEAGDWRVFYVKVVDPKLIALEVKAQWRYKDTSLIVYTLGPEGQFAGMFYGSGASYHYYLGRGRFLWVATGGYAGRNISTIVFPSTSYRYWAYPTPKPNLGVYTIIVRTALFDGSTTLERFRVSVRGIRAPIKLPDAPQPSSGSADIAIRFPYRVTAVYAYALDSPLPIFTSQILGIRDYNIEPWRYVGRFKPNTVFRFTLEWNNIYPEYAEWRKDISALFVIKTPENVLGLPVYFKYRGRMHLWTSIYVFEDWVITGKYFYWWIYWWV